MSESMRENMARAAFNVLDNYLEAHVNDEAAPKVVDAILDVLAGPTKLVVAAVSDGNNCPLCGYDGLWGDGTSSGEHDAVACVWSAMLAAIREGK